MWLLWILPLAASFLLPATGEVVQSLSNCNQFFLNNVPPNLLLNNMAIICQKYKKHYYFVTMYDRIRRIPIFSAYKLANSSSGRPNRNWKIEPQLALPLDTSRDNMQLEYNCGININLLKSSQAVDQDYKNATPYDRGHLAPALHQPDQVSKDATCTLTNIVPQFQMLNNGQWKKYEESIKNQTTGCQDTYAIVGAVPGNTTLNNRVNIPSHIWAAICCVHQNQTKTSWAYIAENNQNVVNSTTLTNLENDLSVKYGISGISLFNGAC